MIKTLLLLSLLFSFSPREMLHPIKMTTAVLDLDKTKEQLKINFFWDDFESHLVAAYRRQLVVDSFDQPTAEVILDYINKHFSVTQHGKQLSLTLEQYELLKETENVLQVTLTLPTPTPQSLTIHNSLLCDAFDNQSNVLHIKENGEKTILRFNKGDVVEKYSLF